MINAFLNIGLLYIHKNKSTFKNIWNVSLNSYGQQFHWYQQNEQSLLTRNNWTQKSPRHMALEIHVLAWDSCQNVAALNRLMGS